MQAISPDQSLADLVVSHAGASRVFHRHGLDFCCGGQTSLQAACEAAGLQAPEVATEIEAEQQATEQAFIQADEMPIEQLLDHILENFHAAHRAEVPRLLAMARKVEMVHSDKPTCPTGLGDHLEYMHGELEQHMLKEEEILFPMIRAGHGAMAAMPIQVMEHEHHDHGRNLTRLRELAHEFKAPPEACGTWQALYLGLDELQQALMQHIHLESNVLFPRVLRG
ncbi:MAG: iron-sulfur cluster repair protein YtfE [Planctomycetota bacterium]|jgi:regulator of cell morphogenesis and NO signaling|nr:iron-sulfur cluster repair protein YtfE [Planctomycetota bacterium]MDP6738911.1 iron-sulfur cluster repair protein YtfE [Planctomycetota bacterium]MDP6937217.1 iron-sulfur cluster repair protein YtfE [Planctomycetota bacterium]